MSLAPRRVLIASDQRDWVANFADGYRRLGFDVTTGLQNFDLEASQPDVVHLQWPEELVGWKLPTAARIDALSARLDRWAKRARLIVSVNNLYPHGQHGNPVYHRLYTTCYERAEVIHHFSEASKKAVLAEYPSIAGRNHVVRVGFNYDLLLPSAPRDRMESRRQLGIAPDEIAYLVFGALRFWDEVQTIRRAFAGANVPRKRLIMAGRYAGSGSSWQERWRRWLWRRWQQSNHVRRFTDYIPEEEVYRVFDAADVVVVIRQAGLSSGVPSLAMTFGRMVIAPSIGGIPEYVGKTGNLLYDPVCPDELAAMMEKAANSDREAIGATNRKIADQWNWPDIVKTCMEALPAKKGKLSAS